MDYKVVSEINQQTLLDQETFQPFKTIDINIKVFYPAQIDGHGWSADEVKQMTDDLIEDILVDIRKDVIKFVLEVNPFSSLCFIK